MTYVVPDPRTEAFARIPAGRCLIVVNSDRPWSETAAAAYAAARGIPTSQFVRLPLGTTRDWDPGTNSVYADIANTLRAAWIQNQARAILIAPGCPDRVAVRGEVGAGNTYDPAGIGYPPFAHLVMGSPSYNSLVAPSRPVACRENGSGRWEWWLRETTAINLWSGRRAWALGLSDSRTEVDDTLEITDARPLGSVPSSGLAGASIPTPLATQWAGDSRSRVIPCGKIGWGGWRAASVQIPESELNWDGPLTSSLAADALAAQPAKILFSLADVSGEMIQHAAFANAARTWGYDVGHFYRTASIPGGVEALCPVASAEWTKAAFEGGGVVGAPFYALCGTAANADQPQTLEPFRSALAPVDGAAVLEMSPSYGFEWAIRSFLSGGASGSIDVTHRTSFELAAMWTDVWHTLRGMTGLEMSVWNGASTPLPAGDPLHRPFHFDPAGELPLLTHNSVPQPPTTPADDPPFWSYTGERNPRHGYRERRGRQWRW